MTYADHLRQLQALSQREIEQRMSQLTAKLPKQLRPWPVSMPASLDPKLIMIGASPGNSPMPGDAGPAFGYTSAPTVSTPENSHYYYPDTKRYTEKIRYLAHGFCLGEGSLTSERDALSISSHLNLGTGRAGQATIGDVDPDVIAWVSDLLNNVHNPDVIVLFGLKKILSHPQVNDWWNCAGGLQMDWRAWHRETPLNGYSYSFKEWTVRNAHGHAVRVVMWPNHPSRVPFGDMNVWKRAVHQYFGLDTRPSLPKRPVRVVKRHEAQ